MGWTSVVVVVTAGALALAPGGVASAESGDAPTRSEVLAVFGPTPAEWAPQGVVIADSGFDPAFDSFPFVNYPDTLGEQNALLGYPKDQPAVGLTSVDAERLFGADAACAYTDGVTCIMNPAVAQWVQSVNTSTAGGHCFGIAAVVAGLYDGVISRAGLTPSQANFGMTLSPAVQREITRWYSTQNFFLADKDLVAGAFVPPDEIVAQLVQFLPSGTLPYLLVLWIVEEDEPTEGHAITPYAVYDRGDGKYDIAVYDNNYPLRPRAVHVDTGSNAWEYQVFANPGGQPVIASGDAENLRLGLIPLAQLVGQQECSFCADAPEGTSILTVSELRADDAAEINVRVTDPDGRPLKGLQGRPTLDPSATSVSFTVPTSTDYEVTISTPGKDNEAVYSVSSFAPGEALTAVSTSYPDGRTRLRVSHDNARIEVASNSTAWVGQSELHLDRGNVDSSLSVSVNEAVLSKQGLPRVPRLILTEEDGVLSVTVRGTRPVRVDLAVQRVSPATGVTYARSSDDAGVPLRPGSRASVDVAGWRHGKEPTLTLEDAQGRTRSIDMSLIGAAQYEELVSEQQFGGRATP